MVNKLNVASSRALVKLLATLGIKAAHEEMMYGKIRDFFRSVPPHNTGRAGG